MVVVWRVSESELTEEKSQIMAQQRQIEKDLGTNLRPFLKKTDAWTAELAAAPPLPEANAPALADVRTAPGVYLRLPLSAASSPEAIRDAAGRSLHDGFTSCFFVGPERAKPAPLQACEETKDCAEGLSCTGRGLCEDLCYRASDCAEGLLCDENHLCSPPVEPYNMRLAYQAYRVLSPEWNDELQMAPDEITVRLFRNDLEKVISTDVPIGIKLLNRAKYFTLILDEEPEGGMPTPLPKFRHDSPEEPDDSRIQRVPHWARVGVWDLATGELLFRDRIRAEGKLLHMGAHPVRDPHAAAAQAALAHSCSLALEVRNRMGNDDEALAVAIAAADAENAAEADAVAAAESEPEAAATEALAKPTAKPTKSAAAKARVKAAPAQAQAQD